MPHEEMKWHVTDTLPHEILQYYCNPAAPPQGNTAKGLIGETIPLQASLCKKPVAQEAYWTN